MFACFYLKSLNTRECGARRTRKTRKKSGRRSRPSGERGKISRAERKRRERERKGKIVRERASERAGRGDSLREKTPVFIVFVKYYCSDFILTIVFFCFVFCWFLPWLGFESVCVCFACCCLNVMQGFLFICFV